MQYTKMEEGGQKVVVANDVMNLEGRRKNIFFSRSLRNFNIHEVQDFVIVNHREQIKEEKCWEETVDPVKLVIGKVIGRGSFGVVHKASYNAQTVAVKVLDFGDKGFTKASAERMKNDFVKEVGLWQNLDHPNITKMIGATMCMRKNSKKKNKESETESNFCIVSEFVKRGSLRSYLFKNKFKKLPMNIVLRFAIDIAKGLSYLHSKRIIHRDVKPENMLIDKWHTIKLADFGESVHLDPLGLFLTSGEIGTRGYMAPEVVSRKPYGHKCDVYSFGICLWEIYCCDMAYTYDLDNITPNIYEGMRPSIPVTCPRPLARLMERCWDTNPSKRPEMKDVVVELEEIRKSEEGWQTEPKDQEGVVYGCLIGLWRRQGRY